MLFLGSLVVPAGAGSVSNQSTTAPFVIPAGCPALEFLTTGTDVFVEVGLDPPGAPFFATSAARGFPLPAGVAVGLDVPPYNPNSLASCAAVSALGATVQVWALWRNA